VLGSRESMPGITDGRRGMRRQGLKGSHFNWARLYTTAVPVLVGFEALSHGLNSVRPNLKYETSPNIK
jgi:hypothetical protein